MGKRKREEASPAVTEELSLSEVQPVLVSDTKKSPGKSSNNSKRQNVKAVERSKKLNSSNVNKSEVTKVSNETSKTIASKSNKAGETFQSSSSSSDSESEKNSNQNDKKSVSDSNSDSDSDSSDSDSSPSMKNTKSKPAIEVLNKPKNSVVNLSPVKSYKPPPKSSSSDSYHSDTEEEDKKRRKKQKKLIKAQLTKKAKRGIPPRREVKQEYFDDLDIKEEEADDDDVENVASNNDEVPDWPESDYKELLKRIELQIPPKDNLMFTSRAAKLDWNQVAFGDYSGEDCYDQWILISKRIRRFRYLSEMIVDAKDWLTKPWTNFYRGQKKNRHPDMPSRPLTTYMIYYLEHKDDVAKKNPGLDMTQLSKIIAEMYKKLSASERDRYTELAAKERQNFDEKLSEFYREHPDMVPAQSKTSAREVATKGPKKPSTPFKLYFQEHLKTYGDESPFDRKAAEEAAKEKWKLLSDKKKLVWIDWALEDSKRYEEELKVYNLEHPECIVTPSTKAILNKDERLIKERLAGKPMKPPNSAYSLFSRVMLQSDAELKSVPPKLRMAEISKKWKEVPEAQKQRYEERVRQLTDAYKLEFASYLEGLSKEERDLELQKSLPKRKKAKSEKIAAKKKTLKNNVSPVNIKPEVKTRKNLNLFKGEPEPPPVRVFDLFLKTFLAERPPGTSEATRNKEAPRYWEILQESKKESYRKKLHDLKQKYIQDYEVFLKGLSPDELKAFSLMKAKAKKEEEAQEQMERINGTLSESNEESDEEEKNNESSSDSDSDESDSGKSSKSSSSSEDSE